MMGLPVYLGLSDCYYRSRSSIGDENSPPHNQPELGHIRTIPVVINLRTYLYGGLRALRIFELVSRFRIQVRVALYTFDPFILLRRRENPS